MNNKSITLQAAIILAVTEFANQGKEFSTHDITNNIRGKVNTGVLEIPEVESLSGIDAHRFDVKHAQVKSTFRNLYDNGTFDADYSTNRTFNGLFFTYKFQPTQITSNVPVAPLSTPVTVTATSPLSLFGSGVNRYISRIQNYIVNCSSRKMSPSIKQVQSAIKRGNKSTGVSSQELIKIIQSNLGYTVQIGSTNKTTYVVA